MCLKRTEFYIVRGAPGKSFNIGNFKNLVENKTSGFKMVNIDFPIQRICDEL